MDSQPINIEMSLTYDNNDSEDSGCEGELNAEEHTADALYADQCAITDKLLNYDASFPRQVLVPNTPEDRQPKKKSPTAPISKRYRKVRVHTPFGQRVNRARQVRLEKELAKSDVIRRFEASHAEILRKLDELDVDKLRHRVDKLSRKKVILKRKVSDLKSERNWYAGRQEKLQAKVLSLYKDLQKVSAWATSQIQLRTCAVKSAPRKGHPGKSQDY